MGSNEFSICIAVTNSEENAKQIGKQAVEKRLSSGVNIISGVKSVYVWKGDIKTEDEVVMLFYTRESLAEGLTTLIKEMHPYEVPPVSFVNITSTLTEFLGWIGSNTASDVEDY
jgi:periplasmic divalent cation tolerance protein